MTDPMVLRLFWKEYRVQRGFWLSLAGLTLTCQLLVAAVSDRYVDHAVWMFGLAIMTPAFYALGCGATTFAVEREEGTLEQLRILAVPAGRLFLTKVVFGLASALALLGVLLLLAFGFARSELPTGGASYSLIGFWGFALIEMFAWGVFFSLLTSRPLNAVFLGAGAWLASFSVVQLLARDSPRYPAVNDESHLLRAALLWRLLFTAIVLALDGWLCWRWLSPPRPFWSRGWLRADRAVGSDRALWSGAGWRLVWQEWRQAWRMMAVLGGIALGLALLNHVHASPLVVVETGISWLIVFALPPLMGACAFLAEQEAQRFRFFAERGVSPRRVWLAKHLVWLPASLLTLIVASGVIVYTWVSIRGRPLSDIWDTTMFGSFGLLWAVVAYSAGQLASMLLQRGLLAGVVALVLSACLAAWQALMAALGVSLWISVAPVPVVLMLITWLRAPDWMLERHKLGAWLRITAVLLSAITALIAGVAADRVYEIPHRSPGFSLDEFLRPVTAEEAATADLHRKATAALQSMRFPTEAERTDEVGTFAQEGWDKATAVERDWLDANREAVEIALHASGRGPCVFHDPRDMRFDTIPDGVQATREFAMLIMLDARRLESEGQLDAALERYVATIRLAHHAAARGGFMQYLIGVASETWAYNFMPRWAAHPDQTPERIRHAIRELEALAEHAPPLSDAMKVEYHMLWQLVHSDWSDLAPDPDDHTGSFLFWMMDRCMPWERRRALRLLDLLVAADLERMESVQQALAEGRAVPHGPTDPLAVPQGSQPVKWRATTFVLQLYYPATEQMVENRLRTETLRRGLLVILALKGWQIEHGELPESLDQLAGDYFDRMPLDAYAGGPFGYSRGGFDRPLESGRRYGFSWSNQLFVEPHNPLIWSKAGGSGQVMSTPRFDGEGRPVEALDGWPFLIP